MRILALILLVLGATVPGAAAAEAPPALSVPAALEQQLDALDSTDAELEQLRAQLAAAATTAERKSLEARRDTIEAFQAALLKAIEQAVGPLPPPGAPAAPAPASPRSALEQQLEQQRHKDETLLDGPVIRN